MVRTAFSGLRRVGGGLEEGSSRVRGGFEEGSRRVGPLGLGRVGERFE